MSTTITIPKEQFDNLNNRLRYLEQVVYKVVKKIGLSDKIKPKTEYRLFTDEQIEQWMKEDELPPELAKRAKDLWPDLP